MIYDEQNFYQSFQDDYHLYKLNTLYSILQKGESFSKEYIGNLVKGLDLKDFERMIKCELRQTLFHLIETIFEVIFGIYDIECSENHEHRLHLRLPTSEWSKNYSYIQNIASSENALDYMNREIKISESHVTSVQFFLFYRGIIQNKEYSRSKSCSVIKKYLRLFAQEFINRSEYNAYKHGLRLIPVFKEMRIAEKENIETKYLSWNVEDSISFISMNKKGKELICTTRLFDYKRDYLLGVMGTLILQNLIRPRRWSMRESSEEKTLAYFGEDELKSFANQNVPVQNLVTRIKL